MCDITTEASKKQEVTVSKKQTLLWLDLEMTGLSPEHDTILQCAALVTDHELNPVAEGIEYTIHHTPQQLAAMHQDVRTMHSASGLLELVHRSTNAVAEVEEKLIAFFTLHCEPHKTLLCGNSIWVDRGFLKQHMPRFEALFFYRMIDVSTIKELALRWYPQLPQYSKQKRHTARADLAESIAELAYYRKHIFK
jgi:oligoribonuclease